MRRRKTELKEKTMSQLVLYDGRPEDLSGREDREIRTYDFLDRIGIRYGRMDHEPVTTIDACEAVDNALGFHICKNLFLCNRKKTEFFLLVMPGLKTFRAKELKRQVETAGRLSFAHADKMLEYLDIEPGAVSIMGLMNDKDNHVQLLIDREIAEDEWLGCHPCVCTTSLKIKMKDILETYLPAVGHEPVIVDLTGEDAE